jgi:pyrroloquinoline quinone (PQQ) biosynthesis protein C
MHERQICTLREVVDDALHRIQLHRFVTHAHQARLTRSQLIRWMLCAGRESKSFPDVLANMIVHVVDPLARKVLTENLDDEYGNGDPQQAHFQHYLQLISAVGLSQDDFNKYTEGPGIKLALDLAYAVSTQSNPAISLGYMLVNEGMTPVTYDAVGAALIKYEPDLDTTFFQMHVEVDEQHVAELYRAVEAFPDASLDDMLHGVALGERGMAVLLDEALGVFDREHSSASI